MPATIPVDRKNQINKKQLSTHADPRVAKMKASSNKQYYNLGTFFKKALGQCSYNTCHIADL